MASFSEPSRRGDALPPVPKAGGIAARALAGATAPTSYLDGLNPEQRRAVETLDGPVLVLAGAGTGKTRVLTTRIAHILATGRAWPSQILAVTFTNRAAREMRERISAHVGGTVEGMPWLGTFHSIGTKILRRHAELVGLRSDFTILDTDDQIRLLKQVIQAENLDEKRWPARQLANLIDGWKNRGLGPDAVPPGEGRAFGNGKGGTLYASYQDRLTVLNAADFGDLLLLPIRILKGHADVLEDYRRRFRFMLVDEYQDTNIAQYLWLRLLAGSDANLCCVGDDDQSIYGWRGAEVDNILRFEQDFPGAAVIRLERNYRSTAPILACAAHLIAHNEGRLGKTLFTDDVDPEATPVTVASAWDSEEEARAIGEEIEALQRKGVSLDQMAILVRASFQMREFEDRFVTLGLNYRVIGGPRFYERLEIRDALAYFRSTVQPADDLAFERIINTPKRGLGDATVKLLHDTARAARIPLMQAARDIVETEELKPKARTTVRDLLSAFGRWRALNETTPHHELAEIILDESGYTEMWRQDRSADAPGRLDNLKELIRSMQGFETMGSFLEHVSLVMEAEAANSDPAVTLMTLHAAKGLEYDTVFLPGWEEGLFPHQRSLDESGRAGLEEERRLAYVGITRARTRAYVWFASNRRIHGLWQSTIPSRFLDELPEKYVDVREAQRYGGRGGGAYGASRFDRDGFGGNSYSTPGWERARARAQEAGQGGGSGGGGSGGGRGGSGFGGATGGGRGGAGQGGFGGAQGYGQGRGGFAAPGGPRLIEGELVAKSVVEGEARFAPGARVFHQKFGNGNVTAVDGNKLTVSFDKAGVKRVLDSFVEGV